MNEWVGAGKAGRRTGRAKATQGFWVLGGGLYLPSHHIPGQPQEQQHQQQGAWYPLMLVIK